MLLPSIYWPLLVIKSFKKVLRVDPELWGCTIFWNKDGPFAPNKNYMGEILKFIFIYLLTPFIVQNFKKKLLQRIQSYEDVPFLGSNKSIWASATAFVKFYENKIEEEVVLQNYYWTRNKILLCYVMCALFRFGVI